MLYCDMEVTVLQGGSLPDLHKRGGGVHGDIYISGYNLVCNILNHTACLHR